MHANRKWGLAAVILASSVTIACSLFAADGKVSTMKQHATGEFDVKMLPIADAPNEAPLGRMSLDKQYRGDLQGVGQGLMMSAGVPRIGSGAYVAMERVVGTLKGKKGSFYLHHRGLMDRGTQQLEVAIVPGSGTEELAGLTGAMTIRIESGKHFYDVDYAIEK